MLIEPVTHIDADAKVVILCGPTAMHLWSQPDATMPSAYVNHSLALQLQQRAGNLVTRREAQSVARLLSRTFKCSIPFHALVPSKEQSRKGKTVVYHSLTAPLPPGSLVGALPLESHDGLKVLLASPEFSFLQFAARSGLFETIDFGNELCGGYAINKHFPNNMCNRQPVTSTKRILHYLSKIKGIYGIGTASLASKYIVCSTKSPWESRFSMLLRLPTTRYGGIGLDDFLVNQDIALTGKSRRMFRNGTCEPDFQLANSAGVIELDGDLVHSDDDQIAVDRRKSNALILMGRQVLRIDVHQLHDFAGLMNVCESICELAGLPPEELTQEQIESRAVLHRYLLHGMPTDMRNG